MATSIGNLALKLSVDGATFSGSMDKAAADVKKFADTAKKDLGDLGKDSGGGGLGFFAVLGLSIDGIKKAWAELKSFFMTPIDLAGSVGLATLRFKAFLGSAEKAKDLMEGLKGFSVRFGVDLEELQHAARLLIAAGVEVGNLKEGFDGVTSSVKEMSDAISAGMSNDQLGQIADTAMDLADAVASIGPAAVQANVPLAGLAGTVAGTLGNLPGLGKGIADALGGLGPVAKQATDALVGVSAAAADAQAKLAAMNAEGFRIGGLAGTLKVLQDVASGSGVSIEQLAHDFARIKEMGKVTFRDIKRMVGEGIPITESIAKARFPDETKTVAGLEKAKKKIQELGHEGKLTFEDLAAGFNQLTGAGGAFFGFADKLSGGFGGLRRRIGQEWNQILEDIGNSALKGFDLKQVLDGIRGVVAQVKQQLEGVLLPAFQKAGELARLIWSGFTTAWTAFGLPTFKDIIDWVKDLNKNLPNFAQMITERMEKFFLNASTVITEIKHGMGSFLRDVVAPLLDSLAEVGASLANIALQSVRLDDLLHPGRRWLKGMKEEHDKMIKDLEGAVNPKPIKDLAEKIKGIGQKMTEASDQQTKSWIRSFFGDMWQNFILLTQGFKPPPPTIPGMIPTPPKPEPDREPARFAGAVDRSSKEAYSAILKFKADQEDRAYPPAEQKADAKKLLNAVKDVDQGIKGLDKDRVVEMA